MTKKFRPMLAATADTEADIKIPGFATPKIDGIRSTVLGGTLYSRKLRPIPNEVTQALFGCMELDGLDGELAVGPPNSPTLMQDTTSGVMSKSGDPEATFWVFDDTTLLDTSYANRQILLDDRLDKLKKAQPELAKRVKRVPHHYCPSIEAFRISEEMFVADGFEGVVFRAAFAQYKMGRSTLKEHGMVKFKRFLDAEAEILGMIEGETNTNEKTKDELGYAKRSTAKAGKVKTGKLGSFLMRDLTTGVVFQCGTGRRSAAEKAKIMENHDDYVGKIAVYRYFPVGVKEKPRFPQFKCLRHPDDMS